MSWSRLISTVMSCAAAVMLILIVIADHPSRVFQRNSIAALWHEAERMIRRQVYMQEDGDEPFTCWGDSLTSGSLATYGHDYPDVLSDNYHRATINRGIPRDTSTQIARRMLARHRGDRPESVIIWAGRNNVSRPEEVESDIGSMVASLTPGSRYLVLGVLNADEPGERQGEDRHDLLLRLNADLSRTYGARYVAIREALIANANLRWPEDAAAVAADVIPPSLRVDAVHLNDHGQAIVAEAIERVMIANRW